MTDQGLPTVDDRIAALEQAVAQLQLTLAQIQDTQYEIVTRLDATRQRMLTPTPASQLVAGRWRLRAGNSFGPKPYSYEDREVVKAALRPYECWHARSMAAST